MSPVRSIILGIWLPVLVALALVGCGDQNSQSTFSADSGGAHVAGWLPAGHKAAAMADINSCTECHGGDFAGGISKVACIQCHMGDRQTIHPLDWGDQTIVYHRVYVIQNGTAACATLYCHGRDLTGVTGSGPSCAGCHPWPTP